MLALVIPGFAKEPVRLVGKWEAKFKSIQHELLIQAWIEDDNKNLLLEFFHNIGIVHVTVKNAVGEDVYSLFVDTKSMSSAIISLEEEMKQGYLLTITDGENMKYGYIFIN